MIILTGISCYMSISVPYIYKKTKLELTLNLPHFSFFSFYDDDRICINFQHKVRSSISVVDRSDSRVGTSNHTKLGYMREVNIFSLLL